MIELEDAPYDPKTVDKMTLALNAEGVTDPQKAAFVRSIYGQESGSGANTKTSNQGAKGGMQVIDSTFREVAPDLDPSDPVHNLRAGARYALKQYDAAGGNPKVAAAGYYGGPGGREAAARGEARYDKKNATAPNTLQYGEQVANRMKDKMQIELEDVPSETPNRIEVRGVSEEAPPASNRIEVRGTSGEEPPTAQNPEAPPTPIPPKAAPKGFFQSALDTTLDAPTNFVAGAGKLAAIPIGGAVDIASGQKLGTDYKERSAAIEQFRKEHTRGDSIGSDIVQAAPEMIMTAPLPGGTLAKAVAANAGYEGAKSLAKGNDVGQVAEDAAMGGAGAGAGHALFKAVGGLRSGLSQKMREFTDAGYVPTIGQMGGSVGKAYEWAASHLPGMAGAVERSAADASETVSRARANEALKVIGERTNKTGNAAVKEMNEKISGAYTKSTQEIEMDPALGRIANLVSEHELNRSVPLLKGKAKDKVIDEIKTVTAPYVSGRQVKAGSTYKKMDEELGELARKYEKGSVKEQRMGQAIRTYQQNLRKSIYPKAGADPGVLDDLRKADQAFKAGVPVKDAAKRARAADGKFTATQDAAATDRARQPRSEAGAEIIANPSPAANAESTGHVLGRWGTGAAIGGGLHAGGATAAILGANPLALAGAGVAAGAYGAHQLVNTRFGRTALLNGLAGVVPKSALSKVSGLPPEEAARVLKEWMAKPEVAKVAASLGRQLTNGGQDAP